uniref:phosphatase PAP2 family protein n=1 Tax=Enterocloster clostridioformis TaxID=1531 RepID=UPI0025A535C2|nr:phosphatase PAP2 family protein [Enterocloster clostridioformis]
MHFELSILDYIQSHLRSGFLDTAMPLITTLGNGGAIWIGCSVALLLIPKTRKAGAAMAVSLALEVLCCNVILKPLVGRIRPCDVNTAVQLLIARPTDFSFPSGHTGASFAAASALYCSKNRLWIPSLVLAIMIAFSRLYLYVHYPSDVLAGILIGIMAGWFGYALTHFTERKLHEHRHSAL